jgi:hypothetical protein
LASTGAEVYANITGLLLKTDAYFKLAALDNYMRMLKNLYITAIIEAETNKSVVFIIIKYS